MYWSAGMWAYDAYLFLDSKSCSFAESCERICIFAARPQGQRSQRDFVCAHQQRFLAKDSRSLRNAVPFRRRHWEFNGDRKPTTHKPSPCQVLSFFNAAGHVQPTLACLGSSFEGSLHHGSAA